MNSATELASIAADMASLDRRLDDLWRDHPAIRDRLDAIYAEYSFDPRLGHELTLFAQALDEQAAAAREDERAIVEARIA